jgi:hypothetical protein
MSLSLETLKRCRLIYSAERDEADRAIAAHMVLEFEFHIEFQSAIHGNESCAFLIARDTPWPQSHLNYSHQRQLRGRA